MPGRHSVQGVIILPGGDTETIDDLDLETLQQAVGGYIETVPLKGATGIINEDGKRLELRVNEVATVIAAMSGSLRRGDSINGPMVVVGLPEDGELTPIDPEIADLIINRPSGQDNPF